VTKLNSDYLYGHTSLVDPRRKLLVYAGHDDSNIGEVFSYGIGDAGWSKTRWATTGGDALIGGGANPGFEYDPLRDRYAGWNDGAVYMLDPDTKVWASYDPPGAPAASMNGTYGRWRYVPSLDVYVVVTGVDTDVHFYKPPAPGAAVAPSIVTQPSDVGAGDGRWPRSTSSLPARRRSRTNGSETGRRCPKPPVPRWPWWPTSPTTATRTGFRSATRRGRCSAPPRACTFARPPMPE